MKPKISIITLGVSNLEAATKFYETGLGLPRHDWDGDIAFFALEGTWLSLYPKSELARDAGITAAGSGFTGFSLAHNVATKTKVNELLRTAVAAGATLVKAAEEKAWGGYSGYFADLDGYLWEVA